MLTKPVLTSSSDDLICDVWQECDVNFTLTSSSLDCGTIEYTLFTADGQEVTDGTFVLVTEPTLKVEVYTEATGAEGSTEFFIRATNPDGGKTVDSENFVVQIKNPCKSTVLNGAGLNNMQVTVWGSAQTQPVPTSHSAGDVYGAEKCGDPSV